MGNGLFQIWPGPSVLLRAPPVRARQELGASVTAKRHLFEQTHIAENEIRATVWKELGSYSLS